MGLSKKSDNGMICQLFYDVQKDGIDTVHVFVQPNSAEIQFHISNGHNSGIMKYKAISVDQALRLCAIVNPDFQVKARTFISEDHLETILSEKPALPENVKITGIHDGIGMNCYHVMFRPVFNSTSPIFADNCLTDKDGD
jgi:hypothetical protein